MQCEMKHDECRNTVKFKNVGQNLGFRGSSAGFEESSSFINNVIWAWYNEIALTNSADIETCPKDISQIGHFLQIVQDQATHVGCAISRYTQGKFKILLFACNYSYSNMKLKPVYVTGNPSCECGSKGRNSKYTSLCN